MLFIDETGAKWVETPEWSMHKDECFDMKAHKVPAVRPGSTKTKIIAEIVRKSADSFRWLDPSGRSL